MQSLLPAHLLIQASLLPGAYEQRSALVAKIADLLERDLKAIAKKESDDTGKRIIEAEI